MGLKGRATSEGAATEGTLIGQRLPSCTWVKGGGPHFHPFSATSYKIYLPLTVLSSALRAIITPLARLGCSD